MLGIAAMFSVKGLFLSHIHFSLSSCNQCLVSGPLFLPVHSVLVSIHLLLCMARFRLLFSLFLGLRATEVSESLFLSAFSFSPLRFRWQFFFFFIISVSFIYSNSAHPSVHTNMNLSLISASTAYVFILCSYPVFSVAQCWFIRSIFTRGCNDRPPQLCAVRSTTCCSFIGLSSPSLPLCNSVVWDPWCCSWVLQQWVYTAWVWFCRHQ